MACVIRNEIPGVPVACDLLGHNPLEALTAQDVTRLLLLLEVERAALVARWESSPSKSAAVMRDYSLQLTFIDRMRSIFSAARGVL